MRSNQRVPHEMQTSTRRAPTCMTPSRARSMGTGGLEPRHARTRGHQDLTIHGTRFRSEWFHPRSTPMPAGRPAPSHPAGRSPPWLRRRSSAGSGRPRRWSARAATAEHSAASSAEPSVTAVARPARRGGARRPCRPRAERAVP
ncbi:MAG: hypothetical protein MZV64_30125 [Ignavibacteriales bacterium]|nr:hypothetical protein [Ignavibacteriales bacterium]